MPDEETQHDIEARPTKELFISILTKDIQLVPAIVDLVDNSIDGARRHRGDRPWGGLHVDITLKPDRFEISDNCGGIEVPLAREVAFRFGRPEGGESVPGSIGVFGVGMKRALFKLAKEFQITSTAPRSSFKMHLNVDAWKGRRLWNLDFDESDENASNRFETTGTTIKVSELLDSAKEDFKRESFIDELLREVRAKESLAIAKGLQIRVASEQGRELVRPSPLLLLRSPALVPAYVAKPVGENGSAVDIRIYVGIYRSKDRDDPSEAGWYVYCNDRQIVGADQTEATGWGESDWGEDIPQYHNQFAWFRGYVFFDSPDGTKLPWNTAKTELDQSSAVLREAKEEMAGLMRPVIDFLNDVDKEKPYLNPDKTPNQNTPLTLAVGQAKGVELPSLKRNGEFVRPRARLHPKARSNNVGYYRPQGAINELMEVFKVYSNKAVGEKTFDYAYKREKKD